MDTPPITPHKEEIAHPMLQRQGLPQSRWVKDEGPGIPANEVPLLFGKFVRLQRDLSGSIRGTGLGLYISKNLVEAMKGRIWVESTGREGEGSRFCFTLPVVLVSNVCTEEYVPSNTAFGSDAHLQINETAST